MGFTKRNVIPGYLLTCLALVTASPGQPVLAQEDEEPVIEEIITIGSRSQRPRSAVTSTAPIDVFSRRGFQPHRQCRRYYGQPEGADAFL